MIYFIQKGVDGPIKIGMSSNPGKRLASLQCGTDAKLTLLGVTEGGADEEKALHFIFRGGRVHGEWFSPSPLLLNYIAGNTKTPENRTVLNLSTVDVPGKTIEIPPGATLQEILNIVERNVLQSALLETRTCSDAANMIGLTKSHLLYKLKKHNLWERKTHAYANKAEKTEA